MIKEIITDKDLIYSIKDYKYVLAASGIKNSYGNGFLYKLCRSYASLKKAIKESNYDDPRKLGTCTVVEDDINIIVCYITKGRYRPDKQPDALDYQALASCLTIINNNFKGEKIASTILGHDDYEAGGDKDRILKMFNEFAPDVEFYLYDYKQEDYRMEDNRIYKSIMSDYRDGSIGKEEYYERKKIYLWQRKYGIYSKPPKDISYRALKIMMDKERQND